MHSFPLSICFLKGLEFWLILQRLSTSVKMVAKGVLKEHLVLLANSMTCAGNLVGFNSGGYKSLSRSLDIQVPFTEATLFVSILCNFVVPWKVFRAICWIYHPCLWLTDPKKMFWESCRKVSCRYFVQCSCILFVG